MVCLTVAGMLKLRKFSRLALLFVKEAGCCRLLFPSKAITSVLGIGCQQNLQSFGRGDTGGRWQTGWWQKKSPPLQSPPGSALERLSSNKHRLGSLNAMDTIRALSLQGYGRGQVRQERQEEPGPSCHSQRLGRGSQ